MIPVVKECECQYKAWRLYEDCHFCGKQTNMWHRKSNSPVCQDCAKAHKVAELPNRGKIKGDGHMLGCSKKVA